MSSATRGDDRGAPIGELLGQPGPTRQDVVERQGGLGPDGPDDLDLEVGDVRSERTEQVELATERDHVARLGPVAGDEALDPAGSRDRSRPRAAPPASSSSASGAAPTSGSSAVRDGRARATSRPSAASTVWAAISR